MRKFLAVIFWSVLSAAFVGPGTVTTAASAGATFGYTLLWALLFSVAATLLLQEVSARLTIVTGLNLGQLIRRRFHSGIRSRIVLALVIGAIIFGCAAYEAGNILGGVSGALLSTGLKPSILTLLTGAIAFAVLWLGSVKVITYCLSAMVALMGLAFLLTAVMLQPDIAAVFQTGFFPAIPTGSAVLVLALVGTTVVPYNLFLGSGLAAGQDLHMARFGISISVILGGLISMAVLIVGASIAQPFSFAKLASMLSNKLGYGAEYLFGAGLYAAGLSSAITAPLAAAITARSLFEQGGRPWHEKSARFRITWLLILLTGIAFGLAGIKPIPAIIVAQALNGIILPLVAIFLFVLINDRKLVPASATNGWALNLGMAIVVLIAMILGIRSLLGAIAKI